MELKDKINSELEDLKLRREKKPTKTRPLYVVTAGDYCGRCSYCGWSSFEVPGTRRTKYAWGVTFHCGYCWKYKKALWIEGSYMTPSANWKRYIKEAMWEWMYKYRNQVKRCALCIEEHGYFDKEI